MSTNSKEYTRAYQRKHYAKNKAKYVAKSSRWKAKILALIRLAKAKACADCKVEYPFYVMDFDHVRGKKLFGLGAALSNSVRAIKAEIKKCEVVCSNCHRERTYKRASLAQQ